MEYIIQLIIKAILAILALPIPFIVGDSTTHEATEYAGYGSGWPGHGFVTGYAPEFVNPLEIPPADYEGPVVLAVSVWDHNSEDLTGYRDATIHYNDLGYDVIWVEVPEYDEPLFVDLNARVEETLGCELADWRYRDVELQDEVHPTTEGAIVLAHTLAVLAQEENLYCEIANPPQGG